MAAQRGHSLLEPLCRCLHKMDDQVTVQPVQIIIIRLLYNNYDFICCLHKMDVQDPPATRPDRAPRPTGPG